MYLLIDITWDLHIYPRGEESRKEGLNIWRTTASLNHSSVLHMNHMALRAIRLLIRKNTDFNYKLLWDILPLKTKARNWKNSRE